ncbi:DEAD/DEAH box helicase [Methanimicrococcus blatticola]|uniref:Fanconi anemia group M protein n=1 Tax=Methanimicrococcus blatticola TaxID=91560 RepID=A0A484F484_9EURY|nr:DEAD/DEAH box helicase [Methanimicrococcus blatticola]MCC2508550.1 DEAD/DEAH box helicase [Methanimicrococcus blatticola]TDQ67856.1 Fanconi anemia group M protein [Methanimicrococcus blatticola]
MSEEAVNKQYIKHPLILENAVEQRLYQLNIVAGCTTKNSLVVLPTSLGKTVVALLVMVMRLEKVGGKVLLLSPTKPLVEQHFDFFSRVMKLPEGKVKAFTGSISPEKRREMWQEADMIIATPQVIENDLLNSRISLNDVSCIVFDEAHRSVGNYAYTYIAEKYVAMADSPLILGITASPGSEKEKIDEVCSALSIENVVVKTEGDADIKPYVHKKEIEWMTLELPKELAEIREALKKILNERLDKLAEFGYPLDKKFLAKRDLLALQSQLMAELRNETADSSIYQAVSVMAEIMKIEHAVELIETQGTKALLAYLKKMDEEAGTSGASKAVKRLAADLYFRQALHLTEKCGTEHPKFYAVQNIVSEQLSKSPDSKIIVFTNFRETANIVKEALSEIPDIRPVRFVGQGSRNKDKGLTQKQQTEIIEQFRAGDYNVLIATSVAEEGLDIPSTDMVLFYEPVPSEIRSIQRKGRTGRFQTGRVIMLITKGTRDEAYRWSSQNKEKRMLSEMKSLQKEYSGSGANRLSKVAENDHQNQKTFLDFEKDFKSKYENRKSEQVSNNSTEVESGLKSVSESGLESVSSFNDTLSDFSKPFVRSHAFSENFISESDIEIPQEPLQEQRLKILADTREIKSGVLKCLDAYGIELKTMKLDVADYVVSDDMAVERKTIADFNASLIDGKRNLFSQLVDLSRTYKKPVLIIEGDADLAAGQMHENSVRGALLSIEIDLNVSIFYTKNEEETALLLKMMAKKEQINEKKTVNPHGKKPAKTTHEQQEYILSSISGVGPNAAQLLLHEFGSLNNIFNASEEDLCRVKGIGKVTAKRIHEVMKAEYKK